MRLVFDVLLWIDQSPVRYWVIALGAYATLLGFCFWPTVRSAPGSLWRGRLLRWAGNDTVFLVLGAIVILAFRWPLLFHPAEFNPDESSFISQALTLRHDPVFWRSISSGTSGPLNVYPLLVLAWLGVSLKYTTARLVGLGCVAGAISFFYLICRRLAAPVFVRVAILPPLTFFALATSPDFVHYSSEHVPLLLLSAACFLSLKLSDDRTDVSWTAFAAGCVLGAVPFSKLQGTLIALTITAFCCLFLLTRRGDSARARLRHIVWLGLGGLIVPALLLSVTAAFGAFGHFWESYLVANRQYANTGLSLLFTLRMIPVFGTREPQFFYYFAAMLLIGALGLGSGAAARRLKWKWTAHERLVLLATAVLAVSALSVMEPGWPFAHYLLFLVIPTALWAFAAVAFFLESVRNRYQKAALAAAGLWCSLGIGWQIPAFHPPDQWLGCLKQNLRGAPSGVAQTILCFATSNEPLCVWGRYCQIYVETGMGRATRDNYLDYRPVYSGLVPDYFKDLYMADLRRANPPVFVDAVTPETSDLWDRTDFNYEQFPSLAKYIRDNYELADIIHCIRVFVRKDRLQEVLKTHPAFVPISHRPGVAFLQSRPETSEVTPPEKDEKRSRAAYALCRLGRLLLKDGRNSDSLSVYRRALELDPDSADAYGNLGIIFVHQRRASDAISSFQKALAIDPDWFEVQWALGINLSHEGRVDEANGHLRRALEIRPYDASPCVELGRLLRNQGQTDEAIARFQTAVALDPGMAEGHYELGYSLLSKGRTVEAVLQWQMTLEIDPDHRGALDNLAQVLATNPDPSLRNGAKAIGFAEHARQLSDGQDPRILRTLAAAYAEDGRFADAIQTAQQALRLADAQSDTLLSNAIHTELQVYLSGSPFHAKVSANTPASQTGP